MTEEDGMKELKQMLVRCEEWPTGLVSAADIASDTGLSVERVVSLADAGYWPHYRFDGGSPMFRKAESKAWAAKNLMQRVIGRDADFSFKVIIQATQTITTLPPASISGVKGLTELTHALYPPGVYFLVDGDDVVYVGQSVNPMSRIGEHLRTKNGKFDRVYFIPVPQFMLDAVEGGFIKLLSPKLNGNPGPSAGSFVAMAQQIHPDLYAS
jgi:hypothetical protein